MAEHIGPCSTARPADGRQQPPPGRGARGGDVHPRPPGTAPGLICPRGREGRLRHARRAARAAGHRRGGGPPRPAAAGGRARRSSSAAPCGPGARPSRAWPSGSPGASTPSTAPGSPTLAFLASGIEGIKIRLTAKARATRPPPAARAGGGRAAGPARRRSCSASTTRPWSHVVASALERPGPDASGWPSRSPGAAGLATRRRPRRRRVFRGSIVSYASRSSSTCSACPKGRSCREAAEGHGRRAPAGCWEPTWGSPSPAWPGRPSRTAARRHRLPRALSRRAD